MSSASATVNLGSARILIVDASAQAAELTSVVLQGFGVQHVYDCRTVGEAMAFLRAKSLDLVLIDPSVGRGEGYGFVKQLRRSGSGNAYIPVIFQSGHLSTENVERARDAGANLVVLKPVTTATLLNRILWLGRDQRRFVDCGIYVGPDRRFRNEGPPPNSNGRRADDLVVEEEAAAPEQAL